MSKKVRRLYGQIKPRHYNLALKPSMEKMHCEGTVAIKINKTGRPSQRVTLHQNGLKITRAKLVKHDKKQGDVNIEIQRINCHKTLQEVRLHSSGMLYPGEYTVELEFSFNISKNMNGLYPCFFEDKGKPGKMLATQFESHHAREVFPCVDEPEAKATFQLELTGPKNETFISNTPVAKEKINANEKTVNFEITPVMSTYLLAFVIGKLKYKEIKASNGTAIRVYATPANIGQIDFALDIAKKCLDFYNNYFGIPYPLAKCDMVALPDFASGAMENWGCITFREQTLLVDDKSTTLSGKQYVAMVIAHELAHQWFGNLVTMRWWTDLWLNEGFASWIEYLALDNLFPEWRMWEQFIIDEQQRALGLDALENTHPVEVAVNHPDEISTIFDTISYSKGSSVIHMLHAYLGSDNFRNGLTHYLKKYAYSNTDTTDLWEALGSVANKPVSEFMSAWTKQAGFPVVSCEVTNDTIKLSQQRFILNPKHSYMAGHTWPIVVHDAERETPEVFNALSQTFKASSPLDTKLNTGQTDFYRVSYDSKHLARLAAMVESAKFSPLDRLGLLSDAFETAKSGNTPTVAALNLLENYTAEDDYAVWGVISSSLQSIKLAMDDEALREAMKPFTIRLTARQLKRLGWQKKPGEPHFDSLLRPLIIGLAASADEESFTKSCDKYFQQIYNAKMYGKTPATDIDQDLEAVIYTTVARRGGADEFNKLKTLHDQSTHSEERLRLCAALTNFRQPELIAQALGSINSDKVRLQDAIYWLAYSFSNRYAKQKAWEWLKDNWEWLKDNLGSDLSFYRVPIYAARVFSTDDFMDEYMKFFKPRMTHGLERAYKQGLEIIQWQSAWRERDLKQIKKFFSYSPRKTKPADLG